MQLYHRTSKAAADAILAGGFRDQTGYYGFFDEATGDPVPLTGVWLADCALDSNEEAAGNDVLLVVELEEAALVDY